jgi:hypothetical protein
MYNDTVYLFACPMRQAFILANIRVGNADSIEVIGESKIKKALNGKFLDTIPGNTVRLYKTYMSKNTVNDNSLGLPLRIAPNPSYDVFHIRLPYSIDNCSYSVADSKGIKIKESILNSGNEDFNLDLSEYPAGVYLLKLHFINQIFFEKLILLK